MYCYTCTLQMSPPYVFHLKYTVKKLLCQGWIKILISILRQTIILEKVTVARYKIQPVHLTKKKKTKLKRQRLFSSSVFVVLNNF